MDGLISECKLKMDCCGAGIRHSRLTQTGDGEPQVPLMCRQTFRQREPVTQFGGGEWLWLRTNKDLFCPAEWLLQSVLERERSWRSGQRRKLGSVYVWEKTCSTKVSVAVNAHKTAPRTKDNAARVS